MVWDWKFQNATRSSFHPMSAKLYEDIGYHGGIQAVTFLGSRLSF